MAGLIRPKLKVALGDETTKQRNTQPTAGHVLAVVAWAGMMAASTMLVHGASSRGAMDKFLRVEGGKVAEETGAAVHLRGFCEDAGRGGLSGQYLPQVCSFLGPRPPACGIGALGRGQLEDACQSRRLGTRH